MPRLSRVTALVALAFGVVVSACAPNTSREARLPDALQRPAVDLSQPVTVALLAPQTAANPGAAQLGQALVNAARMAQADLNDPMLDLRVYDTGGDAARAAAAASQAVAEGAQLILGPLFAESTSAIAGTAQGADINVVSFSTDSSVAGGPVFLSGFLPEMAARRVTGFARSRGYETFGILYPETDYGRVALQGAEAVAGPNLLVRTSYPRTSEAIPPAAAAFAREVAQTGARALLIPEFGEGLQYVGTLMSEQGLRQPEFKYLGLGEWDTRSTLDTRELVGGWFPSSDPGALRAFVDRYRGRFGTVPPQLAFLGYDAVQVAGQLLDEARRTGAGDPFGQAALTRPQGFRGAVGPVRFLPDGRGERGMAILEVGPNSFQVVDPAPVAFGAGS